MTTQPRSPVEAILHLEQAIDAIHARMLQAADDEDFARLGNLLARTCTALFNGHRTLTILSAGSTPMEQALRELSALEFDED